MGSLPSGRVNITSPFTEVGVDYAGPFLLKDRKTRNPKILKAYVALFVCYATKAVHLELVSELTTEAFLACLRRFISRRGKAQFMNSDNGGNFIGASAEIKDLFNFLRENYSQIADTLAMDEITWQFIPPRVPHFGGLWEAGIKSTKHHLKRFLGNIKLTFEEFLTALTQIEAILNSRPLCAMTDDPNDLSVLTPGHFLIFKPLIALPDYDLHNVPENRLNRYQLVQKIVQQFWKRWVAEYISALNARNKWRSSNPNIQMGSLVLIAEDNLPPNQWKLGRVIEVHQGRDGVIRVATIKTSNGNLKRAVHKLCVLPSSNDNEQ